MVKGNKPTTNTATEMKEMRTLIEKLFGELNARQDKFDQSISELKQSIESSKSQEKGVEAAMNASSSGHGNSSTLQGSGKTLTASGPNEKQAEGHSGNKKQGSVTEDDSKYIVDVPTVDIGTPDMSISLDAVVEYDKPYEGCCVTGYYGKRPLTVLIGAGGTSHNFINESLADKLGCDTVPIKPRNVFSPFGNKVTSRACNNFQLSLQGRTVFDLKVYLLPLSSNCDMVLGGEWVGMLDKLIINSGGVEFYFQGKKHVLPFNKVADEGGKNW